MNTTSIAIHGGAGRLVKGMMTPKKEKALAIGYQVLQKRGNALNAVEKALKALEDFHLFNAGKGSVFYSNRNS